MKEGYMKGVGKTTKGTDMVFIIIQMIINTKVNGSTIKSMDTVLRLLFTDGYRLVVEKLASYATNTTVYGKKVLKMGYLKYIILKM